MSPQAKSGLLPVLFIYLFLKIYLFIFGCVGSSFLCEGFLQLGQAGATLHRGARASHCCGLSLRSTGSRHAGSVVVAHGPICSAACGIFPDQGLNPCPLHWEVLPVFVNKILLNTATPIHLWIIYGSLGVTRAELSSYNRDHYGSQSLDYLLCGLNRLLTIIKYQYAIGLSKTFYIFQQQ